MQYLLDIETLLIFLGSRRQSGTLTTNLKRFPGVASKEPCHVHITLIEGRVISCIVQTQEGKVLTESESALLALKKMGQLDWTWAAPDQAQVSRPITHALTVPAPRQPLDISLIIYRRLVSIETINRNALTRRHWQVLLLVDGSRTPVDIANLLMLSPSPPEIQEVGRILLDLQHRGIVVVVSN